MQTQDLRAICISFWILAGHKVGVREPVIPRDVPMICEALLSQESPHCLVLVPGMAVSLQDNDIHMHCAEVEGLQHLHQTGSRLSM